MSKNRWLLAGLLLLCFSATLSGSPASPRDEVSAETMEAVEQWDVETLMQALEEGEEKIVVLDVRVREEWDLGHIRGAVHIPHDQVSERHAELARDHWIVSYCSCPEEVTSLLAAQQLFEAGFEHLAVLVGGYDLWKLVGGPVDVVKSWDEMFAVAERPSGWGKRPSAQHQYEKDEEIASRGKASGRIDGNAEEASEVGSFFQLLDATSLGGKTVVLESAVRVENVLGKAAIWIRAEDEAGKVLGFVQSGEPPIAGTSDWKQVTLDFEVPEGCRKLMFGVMVSGPGTLWIDEVALRARQSEGKLGEALPVVNPGFES